MVCRELLRAAASSEVMTPQARSLAVPPSLEVDATKAWCATVCPKSGVGRMVIFEGLPAVPESAQEPQAGPRRMPSSIRREPHARRSAGARGHSRWWWGHSPSSDVSTFRIEGPIQERGCWGEVLTSSLRAVGDAMTSPNRGRDDVRQVTAPIESP